MLHHMTFGFAQEHAPAIVSKIRFYPGMGEARKEARLKIKSAFKLEMEGPLLHSRLSSPPPQPQSVSVGSFAWLFTISRTLVTWTFHLVLKTKTKGTQS